MDIKLIESVPNFSEGRDRKVIDYICNQIKSVESAKILNVDMGYDANRTVITFIANAENMEEAAFRAIKAAAEKIDMRLHKGEHPRIGATDVMPFIPLSGTNIEDCIFIARKVAERAAKELNIASYCYEEAAFEEHKRDLAHCRAGEYEGVEEKIKNPLWKFDFGDNIYNETVQRSGVSVIGARNFLIAINFNLNTKDVNIAKKIASRIRWSGYIKDGKRINGSLKGSKAIGWYMERYNSAQISMNIVNIEECSLYKAYNEVCRVAKEFDCNIVGSEVIGMLPKRVILESAELFSCSGSLSEREKIEFVIKKMNFNVVEPFIIEKKVIEYSENLQNLKNSKE